MNIARFESWSKERGITSSALIEETPYAGYGLFSSENIESDTPVVVVHIPKNTLLTSQNALKADPQFFKAIYKITSQKYVISSESSVTLAKSRENEKLVLCLFLIYCRFFNSSNDWKSYIDILPTIEFFKENHVLFNMNCVTGTNLEKSVSAKIATLKRELDKITTIAHQLEEQGDNSVNWLANIQPEMYIWSDCVFWSRVVGIGGDDNLETSSPGMALIPFFDFANHSPDKSNIRWKRNKDDGGVDLVTYPGEAVCKKQELLLSYGSKPNQELLFLHGFTIQNNSELSRVTLPLLPFLNPAHGIYNLQKIQWLKQLGTKPTLTFLPTDKNKDDDNNNLSSCGWTIDSIAIMYLVALDEDNEIEFLEDKGEAVSLALCGERVDSLEKLVVDVKKLIFFKVIELRVVYLLLEALEYHHSLNVENNNSKDKETITELWKHASIYRSEEEKCLKLAIDRLTHIRNNLMDDTTVLSYLESMQGE